MEVLKHTPLSRRKLLRGFGAAMALPWLEAMLPRTAHAADAALPRRIAFIYTPNGYYQPTFVPKTTGANWELPFALEPLAKVKKDMLLVTGLDRERVAGTGVHAQAGACWLTSSPPAETLDGGFPTNTSLDQIIAREVGRDTVLPSLELSCNDHADNRETKYFESIAWYGPGYAANTEKDPRTVFNRIFGQVTTGDAQRSVLDVVRASAASMRGNLGRADQLKLDEYLESVRGTERRIELSEAIARKYPDAPMAQPGGIPEKRGDYLRLMAELAVLAFQQDRTRVMTMVVDPERWDSPRMYHGVFGTPENHHALTHRSGADVKERLSKVDRFHVEFYAHVVERMSAIREGQGTLLDNSLVIMGSGMSEGNTHDYGNLQVLMAGRGGGGLATGQHLHFAGKKPLADLWLTLANHYGVKRERFADSTGELKEVTST